MAFANNPEQTELVLPSDGTETPGSGTFVITPNLPTELAGSYTHALIWYSPPTFQNNYKYFYIAESLFGVLVTGYVDASGNNIFISELEAGLNVGVAPLSTFNNSLSVEGFVNTLSQIVMNADATQPSVQMSPNGIGSFAGTAKWGWLGAGGLTSFITDDAGTVDTWQSFHLAGGSFLGLNYTSLDVDYRLTYDRWVDVRIQIVWPSTPATAIGATSANAIPAVIQPDNGPNNFQVLANASWTISGSADLPTTVFIAQNGSLVSRGPAAGPGGTYKTLMVNAAYSIDKV